MQLLRSRDTTGGSEGGAALSTRGSKRLALAVVAVLAPLSTVRAASRPLGDPVPLSQRALLVRPGQFEVALRYGLVGSGPTRFADEIRYSPAPWLELVTGLAPLPERLMVRAAIGGPGRAGALGVEAGIAHLDLGLRLDPREAERVRGLVAVYPELALLFAHRLSARISYLADARLQWRTSNLEGTQQAAVAVEWWVLADLLPYLGLGLAGGYGAVLPPGGRDQAVLFAAVGRPGFALLLGSDSPRAACLAASITYARTESFDVDVFATSGVWPEFQVLFGAGLRWRT